MNSPKKILFNILVSTVESIPLIFFLLYIQYIDIPTSPQWLTPYAISTTLAIFSIVYLKSKKATLNPLFVGINIYFFTGLTGVMLEWNWLNNIYGTLQGSAMLIWIVLLGVMLTFFNRKDFLGQKTRKETVPKNLSLLMLSASLFCLIISLTFSSSKIFGQYLPFMLLFLTRNILLTVANQQAQSLSVAFENEGK